MDRKVIKYGLRLKNSNELLKYDMSTLDDEFSVDIEYSLTECDDKNWLVDKYEDALYVMFNQTPYYNADYNTPSHKYNPGELEIIQLEIIATEKLIKTNFLKIKLKDEYKDKTSIKHYDVDNYKDISYIKDSICYAFDKGDYYQIVKMNSMHTGIDCNFDKKYFEIVL